MNKIQDGWYSGGDSYKPLTISSDMRHGASLSFVNDQVIIRAADNAVLELVHTEGNIAFKILPKPQPAAEAEAKVA